MYLVVASCGHRMGIVLNRGLSYFMAARMVPCPMSGRVKLERMALFPDMIFHGKDVFHPARMRCTSYTVLAVLE